MFITMHFLDRELIKEFVLNMQANLRQKKNNLLLFHAMIVEHDDEIWCDLFIGFIWKFVMRFGKISVNPVHSELRKKRRTKTKFIWRFNISPFFFSSRRSLNCFWFLKQDYKLNITSNLFVANSFYPCWKLAINNVWNL